ncbi:hypothetical protein PFICI_11719 [Pestalotiopsis fici W106-1]|uniref:Clr5 domain-containing protein n=1 Tax=Pestalotiopsis fici (strain W106-1 / CGMCC3.15140) TaxID=1229662 RepID=W3WT70_PESFW|nr:uncharacterized protein PFICI_11719 [Pestalotiopsis fici W106-1]ETS76332.1 hypothetical protein PFICI_11719 [Pestalotiopsis fici W106-1]
MDAGSSSHDPYFLHVKFDQRWECHKDTIIRLYLDEKMSFVKLAETMKMQYRFDANVRQYKYHLKKWNATKNLKSSDKEKVITVLGKRARDGHETGIVRHSGMEVDKKRLRRHLQSSARQQPGLHLQGIVFGRWNLPHEALRTTLIQQLNPPSPFRVNVSTPSDVSVLSPPATTPQQGNAANVPTPTTTAIIHRTYVNRARYLVEGRLQDLFNDMTAAESRTTTNWLHHFWLFSFMSAKYWGKGPTQWSWELLNFMTLADITSSPNTPGCIGASPPHLAETAHAHTDRSSARTVIAPTPLCRWSIHYQTPNYERIPSPTRNIQDEFPRNAPDTWPAWQRGSVRESLADRLKEAIEQNSFSDIERESLPISTTQIVEAVARSPEELRVESIGFAIMAQNVEVLSDQDWNVISRDLDLSTLHPFHLAASYLSGGKTCCNVLTFLALNLGPTSSNSIKKLYINDLGYTVLDCLMLLILKGHTSCTIAVADSQVPRSQAFVGEEIDLCGRWDADSTCVIALHREGVARAPFCWKHVFCHTSVQAICHSINAIFRMPWSPDIDTPSGLFIKYCQNQSCKQKLSLLPLHTLVLVAFHLGNSGTEGETLFGMVACLLCLLMNGANPLERAEISLNSLLDIDEEGCSHIFMTPAELAKRVPYELLRTWSKEAQLGWNVFAETLQFAVNERRSSMQAEAPSASSSSFGLEDDTNPDGPRARFWWSESVKKKDKVGHDESCDHEYDCLVEGERRNFYGKSPELGKLWGMIQAELLTYRRVQEGDRWLSSNFNMHAVLQALSRHQDIDTLPMFTSSLTMPLCVCGKYMDAYDDLCPTVQEACAVYFSNMDDWSRSIFIEMPIS